MRVVEHVLCVGLVRNLSGRTGSGNAPSDTREGEERFGLPRRSVHDRPRTVVFRDRLYAASATAGLAANRSERSAAGRSFLTTVSPTAIAASTSPAPIRYARW